MLTKIRLLWLRPKTSVPLHVLYPWACPLSVNSQNTHVSKFLNFSRIDRFSKIYRDIQIWDIYSCISLSLLDRLFHISVNSRFCPLPSFLPKIIVLKEDLRAWASANIFPVNKKNSRRGKTLLVTWKATKSLKHTIFCQPGVERLPSHAAPCPPDTHVYVRQKKKCSVDSWMNLTDIHIWLFETSIIRKKKQCQFEHKIRILNTHTSFHFNWNEW